MKCLGEGNRDGAKANGIRDYLKAKGNYELESNKYFKVSKDLNENNS